MNATPTPAERQARISEIAHSIWESEGRPSDQALRHWQMAEKLVQAEERHAAQSSSGQSEQSAGSR
ncbi:DUF2934 domain-containing protein [Dyella jejuensis]|uniref:DUF2934 domain-containing protein n=1 Tax=Dyella jejuensis TaxID=1432009 RepID=A0ABW8JLD9_9GAMM